MACQYARVPFFLLTIFLAGCAALMSTAYGEDPTLVPVEKRIAVAPVQFLVWEKADPETTPPDQHLAMLMVTGLERCLRERGYGGFFTGSGNGLLTTAERKMIDGIDLTSLIKGPAKEMKLLELGETQEATFSNTPKILFPAFVFRQGELAARLLWHPDTKYVTYYAFLVDTRTGKVVSYGSVETMGNYQAIEASLRSVLWQRGKMQELVDALNVGKSVPGTEGTRYR